MIKYPDGKAYRSKTNKVRRTFFSNTANRGMSLESDINVTNEYYLKQDLCVITKRPTPINVVKVDYSKGALITEAYFEKQSTTDYNGVYKGKYIDFEAKSTTSNSSLPLANITAHQLTHLKHVLDHGGIAFFIIEFSLLDEYYLLEATEVLNFIKENERKSMPYDFIKTKGYAIKKGYNPRLNYLPIVDELFFKNPAVLMKNPAKPR